MAYPIAFRGKASAVSVALGAILGWSDYFFGVAFGGVHVP